VAFPGENEERTAVGYDMGTAILTHVALR